MEFFQKEIKRDFNHFFYKERLNDFPLKNAIIF